MTELFDRYKEYADRIERAKRAIPDVESKIVEMFDDIRTNHPDISASQKSEVFVPIRLEDGDPGGLIILRWGKKFRKTNEDERIQAEELAEIKRRTTSGILSFTASSATLDADFQYILAHVVNEDIPHVAIAGLNSPTLVDVQDVLVNPVGALSRGIYLALQNPVPYSRSTHFSSYAATVDHKGFLCNNEGGLIKVGTTGITHNPKWNVFGRENTPRPQ